MIVSKELALDILGLPTFASVNDIVLRYKVLALTWFPENHENYDFAVQEFTKVTRAALALFYPESYSDKIRKLKLIDMYGFFQYIFFGQKNKEDEEEEYECETVECGASSSFSCDSHQFEMKEEVKAADNATQLIQEEEREKAKAEKRRAKKKRRKEKKKLEKLEKETKAEIEKKESPKSKVKYEEPQSSDSEEDIDTSSAFVSMIAKKVPGLDSKYQNDISFGMNAIPKEDPRSVVLRSRELALRGNQMASNGYFSEAIELFSEAIRLDPCDHRFYGNRSYCYDRLLQYERALRDAEKSIALDPSWPKGHFRKGRALLGLKKFALAEECFVEVLKLDNDCEDAISELKMIKTFQIVDKGYSKEYAEAAISQYGNVSQALSSMLTNGASNLQMKSNGDIFISDDESDSIWVSATKSQQEPHLYDIKQDPNNPEGHNSLWIGNVQADVTEKKLTSMFSKFGEILSIKVMPEKFCAFVNYKNKSAPGKAMRTYQGFEMSGAKLVIRFPNLPGETSVKKKPSATQDTSKAKHQGPVNGNECYFWRTTGCVYGNQCRYQHVKNHKGVDKKKRQVT